MRKDTGAGEPEIDSDFKLTSFDMMKGYDDDC